MNRSDWLIYKQNRYNLCVRHLQVKVKVMDNILIYQKQLNLLDPNSMQTQYTFVSIFVLQTFFKNIFRCKPDKTLVFCEINSHKKIPHPLNPKVLELILSKHTPIVRCTECQILITVKPVLSGQSKIDKTKVLKNDYCLMQVKSIAECPPLDLH